MIAAQLFTHTEDNGYVFRINPQSWEVGVKRFPLMLMHLAFNIMDFVFKMMMFALKMMILKYKYPGRC